MRPNTTRSIALPTFELISLGALLLSVAGAFSSLHYLRRLQLPRADQPVESILILPATGPLENLEALLAALSRQTRLPSRLLISVESTLDPAYRRAQSLSAGWPFPIDVLVAGEARTCGQKCQNQLAALAWLEHNASHDEAVIIFLDADILPQPGWLSSLATPIANHTADVVSGYRWQQPAKFSAGSQAIAAIDRGISLLPRPPRTSLPWGGSLAFSRAALERLDMNAILGNTISDDCALGEAIDDLGLRFLGRRALLVPTPASFDLLSAWRFGRRQYQMIHLHRPALWWLGALFLCMRVTAWTALLLTINTLFSSMVLAGLLAASITARIAQHGVARRLGQADTASTTALQLGLVGLQPLVDLFHLSMLLAAFRTRRIVWGHVTYDVRAARSIDVVERKRWSN